MKVKQITIEGAASSVRGTIHSIQRAKECCRVHLLLSSSSSEPTQSADAELQEDQERNHKSWGMELCLSEILFCSIGCNQDDAAADQKDDEQRLMIKELNQLWNLEQLVNSKSNNNHKEFPCQKNKILIWNKITFTDCQGNLGELLRPIHCNAVEQLILYRIPMEEEEEEEEDGDADSKKSKLQKGEVMEDISLLKELRCEHCDIGDAAAVRLSNIIGHSTCRLKSLYLKGCMMIKSTIVPTLASGLRQNHSLEYLNLHWSGLVDEDIACLMESLYEQPKLRQVDLAGNLCRSQGLHAITRLIQRPTSQLAYLCLREQCVEDENTLQLRQLMECIVSMGKKCALEYLDLSVNKLTDDDIAGLVVPSKGDNNRSMQTPLSLKKLDLRSNRITDQGIEKTLSQLSGLRKLWLQDNPGITENGALCMLWAAKHSNHYLEYVGFSEGWECLDDGCLDYYTSLNWGGRSLLKDDDHAGVPLGLWPSVLERASQYDGMDRAANILYFLLRHGPALFC